MSIERFSAGGFGPGFYQATDVSFGGETHSIPNHCSHKLEFPHPSGFAVSAHLTDKGKDGADVVVNGPHCGNGRGVRQSGIMNVPIGQPSRFKSLDDGLGDDMGFGVIDLDHVPDDFFIHPKGHI